MDKTLAHGFRWHFDQVFRASSRLLNALVGGEGDTTFSAGSWTAFLSGSRTGRWRVAVVDWLNRDEGHCRRAWEWHRDRGLLELDTSRVD